MILAATCCLPLALSAQKGYIIKGKIGQLNAPAKVYLSYTDDGNKFLDSAIIRKGNFKFKGRLKAPVVATFIVKHSDGEPSHRSRPDQLSFYIENSRITLTTTRDSLIYASIKGSMTNDDEKRLREMQRPFKKTADSIVAVYNKLSPEERKDTAWINSIRPIMQSNEEMYYNTTRAFIEANPDSYISLITFNETDLGYNFNPDTAEARFLRYFPEALRQTPAGKKIASAIDTGKKTNVGVLAMDFQQNDTTGKAVRLSDFRGKYVLLDFWASWCVPCRAENPVMLAAYNKYKDKNFTILGVSLDEEDGRKAWLGAVKHDKLPWTQISDLKGFNSEAAVLYGIKAIPANFLIDPNGRIIARNLRGPDLENKLSEIFSN